MLLLKTIYYLLVNKNIVLINSPLQLINFKEFNYAYKNFKLPIFIGYTNKLSIKQIKRTSKELKLKNKFIFLNEVINVRLVNIILKLRKILNLKFDLCLVGDIKYNLHKDFYKFSKKKYIIDDGTSSLGINKLLRKIDTSNTTLFTVYKNINFKKIKIIQNDYKFLKTLNLTKKTSLKKELHFISSKIGENLKNPIRYYKMLKNLKKRFSKFKIIYIAHPNEDESLIKKKFYFEVIKLKLPLELYYAKQTKMPKKIIFNYSSSLFTINRLFKNYKNLLNIGIKNKSILIVDEHQTSLEKADGEIAKLKIKNQKIL